MNEYINVTKLIKKWEALLLKMIPDEDGRHSVSLEKVIEMLKKEPRANVVEVEEDSLNVTDTIWEMA